MYTRKLDLKKLLTKNHFFLFGPRATGKSSLIKAQLPNAIVFDLLDDDTFDELMRRPKTIGERAGLGKKIVVVDEIQKLPKLLDEIHRLIETTKHTFLLTGSSARKLRRGGANLLAGRAREAELFPLTTNEITDFHLTKFLNFGGLPRVYKSKEPMEELKAYVKTYLNEEIKAEALVRNYERFVRFLETMGHSNGKELNYQNLANDSGTPPRTIEGYIEVLKDTLVGFELLPYQKTVKRKASTKSKFYFFDVGVANYLGQSLPLVESQPAFGDAFEHFLILEVRAYLSYLRIDKKMCYWRTRSYEVDLIIGDKIAVEMKSSKKIKDEYFRGLSALKEENKLKEFYLVGRFEQEGLHNGIAYLNYQTFLKKLWSGELLS